MTAAPPAPPAPVGLASDAMLAPRPAPPVAADARQVRLGLVAGLGAHLVWGLIPIYYKQLAHVPPATILSWRVVAAAAVMAGVVLLSGSAGEARAAARSPRTVLTLAATGLLVASNWLMFIVAVTTGRVLQSSLGYFITPLFIVALGVAVLRERLRPAQVAALLLAVAGVGTLVVAGGVVPWLALGMSSTFAVYSLLRKLVPVSSVVALGVETALLAPLGLLGVVALGGYGPWPTLPTGDPAPHGPVATYALLLGCGVFTAIPLVLFGWAAKRLNLTTLGFIQYFGPTAQFVIAVALYGETFDGTKAVSFGVVWAALALFSADAIRHERRRRFTAAP